MQCLYIDIIASEKIKQQEAEKNDQVTRIKDLEGELEFYKNKDKKNILNEARKNAPCIIFIDEIDFLLNNKAGIYSSTETNIKKILQTYMDGTENMNGVILIGATNYRDNIPPLNFSEMVDLKINFSSITPITQIDSISLRL